MEVLYRLKFEQHGHNPLLDRTQSLAEQAYRSFRIMAILAAAEDILERFPRVRTKGLLLHFGQQSTEPEIQEGYIGGCIEAEVFASVRGDNNVMTKSFRRLVDSPVEHRLLYFFMPETSSREPERPRDDHNRWNDPTFRRTEVYREEIQRRNELDRVRQQELQRRRQPRDDLRRWLAQKCFYLRRADESAPLPDWLRSVDVRDDENLSPDVRRALGLDIEVWSLSLTDLL